MFFQAILSTRDKPQLVRFVVSLTLNEFQDGAWEVVEQLEERDTHIAEIQQELERLGRIAEAKVTAVSDSMKRDAAAGLSLPSEETQRLAAEVDEVSEQMGVALSRLQEAIGISDELLNLLEMQRNWPRDWRTWRHELSNVEPTEDVLAGLDEALEALLRLIDPEWLASQQARYMRLGESYYTGPLHIIGGLRVSGQGFSRPQHYAEMLLLTHDFLEGRGDLDFWALPMALAEVKRLGFQLDEIAALGHEADKKLRRLPEMDEDAVATTIYELLVGAAVVRHGLDVEMLAEQASTKTPDFRVHGLPIPTVIEGKRRVRLTEYVRREFEAISQFYEVIRPLLREENHGWILEVEFVEESINVPAHIFVQEVQEIIGHVQFSNAEFHAPWGKLRLAPLLPAMALPETKLYSPAMLQSTFGWSEETLEWDGLVCEVTDPHGLVISRAIRPTSMKWRSAAPSAAAKHARGITSLYGDKLQQIPPGEAGIIYIDYPEFARAEVADARTQNILDSDWHHSALVRVPLTFVTRLYPRPLGNGLPDLIENTIRLLASWAPLEMVKEFPSRVFTTR